MSLTAVAPQTALDERTIEAPAVLTALELRQSRKEAVKQARKAMKEADDRARALLDEHDLRDGDVVRCGQFRITKKAVPSRAVTFETDPTSRLTISLLPEGN